MLKHILKNTFITAFLLIIVYLIIQVIPYQKNTYECTYNTYLYYWEESSFYKKCDSCTLVISAYTEKSAREELKEILYDNILLAGDSVEILKVVKL